MTKQHHGVASRETQSGREARTAMRRRRLPRISRPAEQYCEDEDMSYGDSGSDFTSQTTTSSDAESSAGFEAYYTTESLFDYNNPPTTPPADSLFEEVDPHAGPYAVLGVTAHATWDEINKARRRLIFELHPDRHVNASPEVRETAERRVRDVNAAFAQIRRERSGRRY